MTPVLKKPLAGSQCHVASASCRWFVAFLIIALSPVPFSLAQTATAPNEGSKLEWDATNGFFRFKWWGKQGHTYFIQHSEDLTGPWQWLPMIESGDDSIQEWGFISSEERFFIRLKYTDIATTDPEHDDFDGDGISNFDELLQGTNPLSALDLDGNGLPDDWEIHYFGATGQDPDADPDGDIMTNLEEFLAGTDPFSYTDTDGDGISDGQERVDGTDPFVAAPAAPSGLTETENPDGSHTFTWVDNSQDEEFFVIEELNAQGSWVEIARVDAGVTSVAVSGGDFTPGAQRRVGAGNGGGTGFAELAHLPVSYAICDIATIPEGAYFFEFAVNGHTLSDKGHLLYYVNNQTYLTYCGQPDAREPKALYGSSLNAQGDLVEVEGEEISVQGYHRVKTVVTRAEDNQRIELPAITDAPLPEYITHWEGFVRGSFTGVIQNRCYSVNNQLQGVGSALASFEVVLIGRDENGHDREYTINTTRLFTVGWNPAPQILAHEGTPYYTDSVDAFFATEGGICLTPWRKTVNSPDNQTLYWQSPTGAPSTLSGRLYGGNQFGVLAGCAQIFSLTPAVLRNGETKVLGPGCAVAINGRQTQNLPDYQAVGGNHLWQRARDEEGLPTENYIAYDLTQAFPKEDGQTVWSEVSAADINESGVIAASARHVSTGRHVVLMVPVELRDIKDHGNSADDVTIVPKKSATDTSLQSVAWIEPHLATDDSPQMPQLELRLPGLPTGLKLKAKLEVKYDRPYADPKPGGDTVQIPSGGEFFEVTGDTWKIYDDQDWKVEVGESAGHASSGDRGFFGGNATLTYRIEGANGSVVAADQEIKFRVAGKNPQDNLCKDYINLKATSQNGAMWFAYAIAKHESEAYGGEEFYNQFKKHGGYYQPVKGQEGAPLQVNAEGYGPGGIGIFQVTGKADDPAYIVSREQIWNWQKNVDAGLVIIRYKREEAAPRALNAFKWMRSETRQSNGSYEGQRPQAREQRGQDVPVPDETVRSVTFTDNAGGPQIEDAVNIKLYNGASNGNYCSWDGSANNGQGAWKFNRTRAYDGKSYVDLVLQRLDLSQ